MTKSPRAAKGPKTTICEVQQWTTTTVEDAQSVRERFVPLDGERCEVFRWTSASVDEVAKLKAQESGLKMRCPECKKPVRFRQTRLASGTPSPHFEHFERNPECSLNDV